MENPCKILVVDDEPLVKSLVFQKFKPRITSKQLEFYFAESGKEALQILEENRDIGVVLTDIKMPEMDGLTLMHELSLQNRLYKIIVISAYGDMSNIRRAMEEGASDFILKPFDLQDFETSVLNVVRQYQYVMQGLLAKDRVIELSKELEIAKQMKSAFIPDRFSPFKTNDQIGLAGEIISSEDPGGDFFDFFPLNEKELGMIVAKIKSKGIPAALYTAMVQMLVRASCLSTKNAYECVKEIHQYMLKELPSHVVMGLFYGALNIQTGQLNYSNTGEVYPYLISQKSGQSHLIQESGNVTLAPFDKLFVTTNELLQVANNEEESFGQERLQEVLEASYQLSASDLVAKVKGTLSRFLEGAPLKGDISLFALQALLKK